MSQPSHEKIAELAYYLYVEDGRPEGKAEDHWKRALEILTQTHLPSDPYSGPEALHQQINVALDKRQDWKAAQVLLKMLRTLKGVEKVEASEGDPLVHIFYDARRTNPAAIFDAIEESRKEKED